MKISFSNKLTAVVIVAAMIFTGLGFNVQDVYAAKSIPVEGVYTNFQKANMVIGTTRQITTYTEPKNATIQKMKFTSSDTEVVTVTRLGLLKAIAPGTAEITVSAMDGSDQTETIKVKVLKDLILSKEDVDTDNEIIVMDKNYGNVTIDESVGNAVIYLSGVTIKGTLLLEDAKYAVNILDSTVAKVVIDEPKANGDEIVSLSTSENNTGSPTLNVIGKSDVAAIEAKINAFIRQADEALIRSISFIQEYGNQTVVYLEGFTGNLSVDAMADGDIIFVAKGCNIADVTVSGEANSGSVQFKNDGESAIGNVSVKGAARLELGVPANRVNINANAIGAKVIVKDTVGDVNNAGTDTVLEVQGMVDTITSEGPRASITAETKGSITTVNVNGAGSIVAGSGEITEIYVNANSVKVNTNNSLVIIGNVTGTTIQGAEKKGGTSVTSEAPSGPVVVTPAPVVTYKPGDVIVSNNFENSTNKLSSTMGSCSMTVTAGAGKDGTAGLKVGNRSANYHGVGYDFADYINKHLTVRIKYDIKTDQDGTLKASMKTNNGYPTVSSVDATAGTWYNMEGTFELDNTVTSAILYIEHSVGTAGYILDNVDITVDSVGDKIPVSSVALDQDTLSMDIGQSATLLATIDPSTADNKGVTWSSSVPAVAGVSNGIVTALTAGTTIITVTTLDGAKTDTCTVNVSSSVAFKLNRKEVNLSGSGQTLTLVPTVADGVTWNSDNTGVATVDNGLVTSAGTGTAIITATRGSGTAICKVNVLSNVILIEDFEDNAYTFTVSGTNSIVNDGTQAYDGAYALKLDEDADWKGIEYTINNTGGSGALNYKFSAYVKGDGAEANLRYSATYTDTTTHYDQFATITAPSDGYVLLEGTVEVPVGRSTTVKLAPQNAAKAKYLVDNFVITSFTPSAVVLNDPSSDTYGLTLEESSYLTNQTVGGVSKVLVVSGSAITNGYKIASIYLDESYVGKTVKVSAKVRRSVNTGHLAWQMYTSTATNFAAEWGASVDVWYTIEGSAIVPASGELYLSKDNATGTTFYIADLVITLQN